MSEKDQQREKKSTDLNTPSRENQVRVGHTDDLLKIVEGEGIAQENHKKILFPAEEEMITGLIETLREPLIILDEEYNLLKANKSFYRTFDLDVETIESKNIFSGSDHPLNIDILREHLHKISNLRASSEDFEFEHEFAKLGKRILLVNARYVFVSHPVAAENYAVGSLVRIFVSIEDITWKRDLLQGKDDFISMASHELKTPVTSIKAFTQIMQDLVKTSKQIPMDYLAKMNGQVDKLTKLINDLLDVSKVQSGKMDFYPTNFDFDALVNECIVNAKNELNTHTIMLHGKSDALVNADRKRTAQVIINFLSNAVKYSPVTKDITVKISCDSNMVVLSVCDSGVGISKYHQKRIFDRFYRVNDSNDKKYPGLGIGLYIANQIIKKQNGRIWVESTKEKGSTFSFSLPVL